MENVTVWLAFGAGLLSFLSPCSLPLYPSYLSYITGITVSDLKQLNSIKSKRPVLAHSSFFLIGFSIVYYALGFSTSWIGHLLIAYNDLIRMIGGVFLIAIGLFLIGIFQPKFLMQEKRFSWNRRSINYFSSLLIGVIFSAGWTPCIGPIFSSIIYANMLNPNPLKTFLNVTAYSLGFALPFLLMSFFLGQTKWILRYSNLFMKVGGALLVIIGVLLYFNKMTIIIGLFN